MKPTLLLDMDGPLAAFDVDLYECCKEFGIELDISGLDDPNRKYYMTENMTKKEDQVMIRALLDRSDFFLTLPVTEGAKEGVVELEKHFDVWVCTKPLDTNTWCRKDKMEWLFNEFPSLYSKCIMAPNKSLVRGSVLLDDAPVIQGGEEWKAIVFTDTFNLHDPKWAQLPHWHWNDGIERLLDLVAIA